MFVSFLLWGGGSVAKGMVSVAEQKVKMQRVREMRSEGESQWRVRSREV